MKPINEVRKIHLNQMSLGKKMSAMKSQAGCFIYDQLLFGEVRYVPKPNLKWVPKVVFNF